VEGRLEARAALALEDGLAGLGGEGVLLAVAPDHERRRLGPLADGNGLGLSRHGTMELRRLSAVGGVPRYCTMTLQ
jgi:hypothetical protein